MNLQSVEERGSVSTNLQRMNEGQRLEESLSAVGERLSTALVLIAGGDLFGDEKIKL